MSTHPSRRTRPPADHAEIDLGDIVLRRWHPGHAEALAELVTANLDHLRPWMPWIAAEPLSLAGRRELLQRWVTEWDVGGDRHWGIYVVASRHADRLAGSIGLMGRVGPAGTDMGYWIDRRVTGRGVVTRSARALTTVAFDNPRVERVEIHHDRANPASGAVPRRLGYRPTTERKVPIVAPGECGIDCTWVTTAAEWRTGTGVIAPPDRPLDP